MEMLYQLGEAVVIAFLLGAVMGAVVAVHLSARAARRRETTAGPLAAKVPAKVRVRRDP